MTRSLALPFAPSSRPVWGRRSLAAFFTIAVLIHLCVILRPAALSSDNAPFLALAFAAAVFATGAVALRQEPEAHSPPSRYRRYAVLSEQALVKEIERLLERATHARLNIGVMLVAIDTPGGAWQDSERVANDARRVVREILARHQGVDEAVFALRDSGVALVSLGGRTVGRLEVLADAVIRESRADFARNAALAGTALTFGITEANPVRGSAEALVRDANLALRRAVALRTGRFVVMKTLAH